MYSTSSIGNFHTVLKDFKLDGRLMRYSNFMPRLYNYCLSIGMTPGKIMPSRAFCSDESQGFPIILIAKQFGTFPFNHGLVGGVVATALHPTHAAHGKDIVIIQASHVGYDPENKSFGRYRRIQTKNCHHSANCGKISAVLKPYQNEYEFACKNIYLEPISEGSYNISINNLLLQADSKNGLLPDLAQLVAYDKNNQAILVRSLSTARVFKANLNLIKRIGKRWPQQKRQKIGKQLSADLFSFKRESVNDLKNHEHLEQNLMEAMPYIVTDSAPELAAAQINTQVEFDRCYRSIIQADNYRQRNLIFISGLNIDISPQENQTFPLTKFIPWAAYVQTEDGTNFILEQSELFEILMAQDKSQKNMMDLEKAIQTMIETKEIHISFKK